MGNPGGRRDQQKARTRARIREVAQELFAANGFDAVTIIEIAATAQVSVQTVFNHFGSKEELFFAERSEWVDGAAIAVRDRCPARQPLTALRRHLVGAVEGFARVAADPHDRRMLEVLDATPALLAFERQLHDESVGRLADALTDAWCTGEADCSLPRCRVLAEVTASVWMAAVRALVLDLRSAPPAPGDEQALGERVALAEQVLRDLDAGLSFAGNPAGRTSRQVA